MDKETHHVQLGHPGSRERIKTYQGPPIDAVLTPEEGFKMSGGVGKNPMFHVEHTPWVDLIKQIDEMDDTFLAIRDLLREISDVGTDSIVAAHQDGHDTRLCLADISKSLDRQVEASLALESGFQQLIAAIGSSAVGQRQSREAVVSCLEDIALRLTYLGREVGQLKPDATRPPQVFVDLVAAPTRRDPYLFTFLAVQLVLAAILIWFVASGYTTH